MILVTGAGGQTGQAVIKALVEKGIEVYALVHRESQSEQMLGIGAKKAVAGDMLNLCDLQGAMDGVDSVYFICSTANPDEYAMRQMAIDAAEAAARIAQERERHAGATYELCGPENLRMNDIRRILETRYHREIAVRYTPDEVILSGLRKSGAGEYRQDAMLKMFHHYNEADFLGSDVVLASLLGRKPHTLAEYLEREG